MIQSLENAVIIWDGVINRNTFINTKESLTFKEETMMGTMPHYITTANPNNFKSINTNFGLVPPFEERIKNKNERYEKYAECALDTIQNFVKKL